MCGAGRRHLAPWKAYRIPVSSSEADQSRRPASGSVTRGISSTRFGAPRNPPMPSGPMNRPLSASGAVAA
ncbi:hypothetical protein B591_04190 [Streptomyces sp. GBA 94-10 4N24]|nr:hypothetical protein B591_04190 [Streptomyces sp. GBA 94-10 4N24]MBP3076555.1 hypothetical protein [Streptomyces sp. 604F]UZN57862.1 hypothetical protein B591N_04190 [Streptomyces sp. GBA 94-10 4N24]